MAGDGDRSGSGVAHPTRQEGARGVENGPVNTPQDPKHTTSWRGEELWPHRSAYLLIHSVPD